MRNYIPLAKKQASPWIDYLSEPKGPTYTYTLVGDPVPLARARYGNKRVYDSQKNERLVAGINIQNQHNNRPLLVGPIRLTAEFHFEPPRSNKKLRDTMLACFHQFAPDLSNCLKWIEDIASGIVYKDDCLIADIHVRKLYSEEPKTIIILQQFLEKPDAKK